MPEVDPGGVSLDPEQFRKRFRPLLAPSNACRGDFRNFGDVSGGDSVPNYIFIPERRVQSAPSPSPYP